MSEGARDYETVIGLEVHVQLRTRSKFFCACAVRYGEEPNHHDCPVCLALPGALPVLNRHAIALALRAALAAHCTAHPHSVFARKNYFYPDLPKGYQISQYEEPLATGGWIEIETGDGGTTERKRIGLTRIHMEEDAGKSIHDPAVAGHEGSLVDLNRAGVPLLEIVSDPDLRSPEEAGSYLRTLRQLLRYVDVSDADLEKGHFRCDANISLRPKGEKSFGTRTELKNLNSFRFVEGALHAEVERQRELLERGEKVLQATLLYEPESGRTRLMRVKENADDYRYFPDPDLIPLQIDPAEIEQARATLPELPQAKRARFQQEYGLSDYEARLLTESRTLADFFESAARLHGRPKSIANWTLRDVLQALKEGEGEIERTKLTPQGFAQLVRLVEEGRVNAANARPLVPELMRRGGDPEAWVRERGLEAVSDAGLLETTVDEVLTQHPEMVENYRAGERKVVNFLMGQVMRRTQGKADPTTAREILLRRLEGGPS
jgi:aspartyl-tRNA(Asn)/glutamyl-tRNA(Gln) amidotransferase subunit B